MRRSRPRARARRAERWTVPLDRCVDCLAIHLSLNGLPSRQHELESHLLELEEALAPFNARAHWGKLAPRTLRAERVAELYGEALGRFKAMAVEHDPDGKFRCGAASSQSSRAAC